VGGELFFGAGDTLGLLVGGGGGNGAIYGNGYGGGGGGGSFVFGGGPSGGYGGGGGGGFSGPGGGGGAPAGESYVISTARNAFGITGGNMNGNNEFSSGANGYLSIDFVAAPEPSTWAMTLTGFAGLAGSLACAGASSRRPDMHFEELTTGGEQHHFFG
jgi:hypothetical protein